MGLGMELVWAAGVRRARVNVGRVFREVGGVVIWEVGSGSGVVDSNPTVPKAVCELMFA